MWRLLTNCRGIDICKFCRTFTNLLWTNGRTSTYSCYDCSDQLEEAMNTKILNDGYAKVTAYARDPDTYRIMVLIPSLETACGIPTLNYVFDDFCGDIYEWGTGEELCFPVMGY